MNQSWSQLDNQPVAELIRDSRAAQLQSCRQRIALFKGLQSESIEDRSLALEKIIQVVKSYIRSTLSPTSTNTSPNLSDVAAQSDISIEQEFSEQLFYYLLTILRLSFTCSYSDVRHTFKNFLIGLKESTSLAIPEPRYKSPSYFILLNDIFSLETNTSSNQAVIYPRSSNLSFSPWSITTVHSMEETNPSLYINTQRIPKSNTSEPQQDFTGGRPSDEYVRQMMIKTFLDEGRLGNLHRILSFFPTFFEIYHITYSKTFKTSLGPLHRTWKAYIGLMVASEQECQYLASIMKLDFLYNGGDPDWLLGLDRAPEKLRSLSGLVVTLARQPWQLRSMEIDGWTRGELVQATLVIATTLGLCSFIMGCGITPEIDMTGGFLMDGHEIGIEGELDLPSFQLPHVDQFYSTDEGVGLGVCTTDMEHTTEELIAKLKSKKNSEIKESLLESFEITSPKQPKQQDETDESEDRLQQELDELASHEANRLFEDLSRFVDQPLSETIGFESFESSEAMEFMLGEYCFEDHGCDLMNHYLPSLGDDLVTEFTEAISITDWSIFHPVAEEVVDTSPLRNAIWYYTQKLMGVTKEDYSYSDIPTYLNERTMNYIQHLCMTPHKIQLNDWKNIGIQFRPEEKCHVNLLIASARKQAILCYGLYVISGS